MSNKPEDRVRIVDRDGKEWTISNIPAKLMAEFNDRAGEMYPNKEAPWMHLILDTISSVCDVDKVTYQLTDIPADMMEQFDAKLAECEYSRYSVLSEMLQAAGKGNFVVGRLNTAQSAPGDSLALVIMGVPVTSWESYQKIAEEAQERSGGKLFADRPPTAMGLQLIMLQMAGDAGFTFTWDEAVPPHGKSNVKQSNGKRKSGIKRGSFGGA